MAAYYNEIDQFAAAWLRELIKAGLIADGEVDTRSIVDVRPADLAGFVQCHFFAGIGGWSAALRLAGWPDDRPVWTGSCPCQPFSVAGASQGTSDPRHLWPAWFSLIRERRPATVFGEQVASADGLYWLDLVYVDLEAAGYAVGAFDLPAASVGAPHGRQRLWIVGHTDRAGCAPRDGVAERVAPRSGQLADSGAPGDELADAETLGRRQGRSHAARGRVGPEGSRLRPTDDGGDGLGHASSARLEGFTGDEYDWDEPGRHGTQSTRPTSATGDPGRVADADGGDAVNGDLQRDGGYGLREENARSGFWDAVAWIPCLDGRARPVEPGTFPLAYGVSARVGRLRGYGNAIVPEVAQVVIEAYMSIKL